MESPATRPAVLVVTREPMLGERAVRHLETLGYIAVTVDSCDIALEMLEVVEFSLVIVDVVGAADWTVCRRLVESRRSPVAVITSFLADDRRYRRRAFEIGVVAYAGKPCARSRLSEMLCRLKHGEREVELVGR